MALHSLYCADVPLRNCSLTHLIIHLYRPITINHSFMYKEAQRHRVVPPAIARHLVYCIGLQLAIRVHALGAFPFSIRQHARPCGAVPRRIDVSRPQKLLAHSSSMFQRLGFEARSCYCVSCRVHVPPCAPMRLNSRPCGSMRAHASFSGTPNNCRKMRL